MPGRAAFKLREMDSARASARRLASPSSFHLSMRNCVTSRCASFDTCAIRFTMELASAPELEYCAMALGRRKNVQNATAYSHDLPFIVSPLKDLDEPSV